MSEWTALINRLADEGVDVDASNALRLLMGLRAGVPLGRLAVMFDVPLTTEERDLDPVAVDTLGRCFR